MKAPLAANANHDTLKEMKKYLKITGAHNARRAKNMSIVLVGMVQRSVTIIRHIELVAKDGAEDDHGLSLSAIMVKKLPPISVKVLACGVETRAFFGTRVMVYSLITGV